jgi:cardiolipin synthase
MRSDYDRYKVFTLPNLFSVIRLLLIPVFITIFFSSLKHHNIIAGVILIFSGLTDVLDGYIARKYNLITELGKLLDPLADKLTQAAVCICLVIQSIAPYWLLVIFVVKEILMIVGGAKIITKGKELSSSKWFGKVATVVFFLVMTSIILFSMSGRIVDIMILVSLAFMLFSFFMYLPIFIKLISKKDNIIS